MTHLEAMKRFAEDHGFRARIDGERVVVTVPWINPTTGEEGTSEESCTDARGLARILGY